MSRLDKLPLNNEETAPAGVEVVKPPSDLEVRMAQESRMAMRASEQAFLKGTKAVEVTPPLLEPKPVVAEVVKPDVSKLLERARERKVAPAPAAEPVDFQLAGAAHLLVNRLASLSAEWGAKVDSMRVERGLRDDQICFALMANSLDSNQHMVVPADHPYFSEKFQPAGTNFSCVICNEPSSRKYPGQPPLCGNKCANQFYALPESDRNELLEAAAWVDARHQSHQSGATPCAEADHYTATCACGRPFMAHSLSELNAEIAEHQRREHGRS